MGVTALTLWRGGALTSAWGYVRYIKKSCNCGTDKEMSKLVIASQDLGERGGETELKRERKRKG